jgi:PHD/YefM family antitoxin component YafN of YafNO toxin-antitoxin module
MNLQYITDNHGHKNGVLIPLQEWNKIQKDLDAFERLKDKKTFFEGLNNAFAEVILIKKGKKTPHTFDELLNEL